VIYFSASRDVENITGHGDVASRQSGCVGLRVVAIINRIREYRWNCAFNHRAGRIRTIRGYLPGQVFMRARNVSTVSE